VTARDITGQRFGRLLVLERAESGPNYAARWRCTCDCGVAHVANHTQIVYGHTRSCGCLRRDELAKRNARRPRLDKGDISVSARTYDRLLDHADATGRSMRQIVEAAVAGVTP
jgi:hypothetical protein